ncbi:hypothetical protein [Sphingomonas cynarae]
MIQEITQNTVRETIANMAAAPATGDYADDCATGRRLADALCQAMNEQQFPGTLGAVIREMVTGGTFTSVHVGLFNRIAERAMIA